MACNLLEQLTFNDFYLSLGFILPPPSMRRLLLASKEVQRVQESLRSGEITEAMIRDFVASLMGSLKKGLRFPHDLALASLAVALERRPTDFAEEYLCDLARLRLAEMSTSISVARECLKQRFCVTKNLFRFFQYGHPQKKPPYIPTDLKTSPRGQGPPGQAPRFYQYSGE